MTVISISSPVRELQTKWQLDLSDKVPAYRMALDSRVVKHFNEINPAWLFTPGEGGLNIIILHTSKCPRSIIKSQQRFKRSLRKIYGASSYSYILHLFVWIVDGSNSDAAVEDFRKQLLKLIIDSDSTNYGWLAPAGFNKGIIQDALS